MSNRITPKTRGYMHKKEHHMKEEYHKKEHHKKGGTAHKAKVAHKDHHKKGHKQWISR